MRPGRRTVPRRSRPGHPAVVLGTVPGLGAALGRLGIDDVPRPGDAAAAVEFVLEGLHLNRRLAKDVLDDGRTVYGGGTYGGG